MPCQLNKKFPIFCCCLKKKAIQPGAQLGNFERGAQVYRGRIPEQKLLRKSVYFNKGDDHELIKIEFVRIEIGIHAGRCGAQRAEKNLPTLVNIYCPRSTSLYKPSRHMLQCVRKILLDFKDEKIF